MRGMEALLQRGEEAEPAKVRLSAAWFPGEWLEPVNPDIARGFLERYSIAMGRLMARYLEDQGVESPAEVSQAVSEEADDGDAEPSRRDAGVDFANLCLIVDQQHTFPIRTRNLAELGYEPGEDAAMEAALALQSEFDGFVDFIADMPGDIDRRDFVNRVEQSYGFAGDIESAAMLRTLAARAAGGMANDAIRDWLAESPDTAAQCGETAERWRLAEEMERCGLSGTPAARLRESAAAWARCVEDNRRNTPRNRAQVLDWCVWRALLSAVWQCERSAYDARWHGVDQSARDSRRFPEDDPVATAGPGAETPEALTGDIWNRLMARMLFAHRSVSRGYSRWCALMPPDDDAAQLRLACRMIADDPAFLSTALFALCNAIVYGRETPPDSAREAMRDVLDYACVGKRVTMDAASGAQEFTYVGLRKAICGYEGYQGVRRELGGEAYARYVSMVAPSGTAAEELPEGKTRSVWIYPGMGDWRAIEDGRNTLAAQAANIWVDDEQDDMSDEIWHFHRQSSMAVSEWLAAETVHAANVDGHGHFLSYRASDPVAPYQDVNAWRLGNALEKYEGSVMWGSGSRLAQLYRNRGHLSKQGGRAADRSIRDYALSARGTSDAIEYIAAVSGLGKLLTSDRGVELLAKLIDVCESQGGDRFRKSCWTLIRMARYKRRRLTVPCATGRRAGMRLLEAAAHTDDGMQTMVTELKLVNLIRAFQPVDAASAKTAIVSVRDMASLIDLAEHYVYGVVQAAAAKLRAGNRTLVAVRTEPLDCMGLHAGAFADAACVFGRDASGQTRREER